MKSPSYEKGKESFIKELKDNFDSFLKEYQIRGKTILTFDIDENGDMMNSKIEPASEDSQFNQEFLRTFKRIKGKWTPTKIHDVPVKYTMKFPLNFESN